MQDRFRARMGFLVGALLTGAIAAACSSDTTEPPPGNEDNVILMQPTTFAPDELTIDVGETVTWRNNTATQHTIRSEDNEWEEQDVPAEQGWDDFSHQFDEAGTYNYDCTLHSGMVGTIVVD